MRSAPDLAAFRARLVECGLGQYADRLVALAEPSIRLVTEAPADLLPIGATKLGGDPDLPPDTAWPRFEDVPHSFIAQINFAEMRDLPGADRLPSSGLASFFFDAEQRVWGFDPKDRDGWRVLYTASTDEIVRTPFPSDLPAHARYSTRRLRAESEMTIAAWESSDVLTVVGEYLTAIDYGDAMPTDTGRGPRHRLLGHPDSIQGDMQRESQLASNGIYCGGTRSEDDPRVAALSAESTSWRLLLQIDSDDETGMQWGDCGSIYYWMHRDDLAARRFERAWCVLQCS